MWLLAGPIKSNWPNVCTWSAFQYPVTNELAETCDSLYTLDTTSYIIYNIFKPGACWPHADVPSFLELLLSANVHMCVCVCMCFACVSAPRLLITSGMMWCDIDPYDWLNKFNGFYMAAVVGIISGRDLSIHTDHRN